MAQSTDGDGLDLGASAAEVLDKRPLWDRPSTNLFGVPGLLDMPGAFPMKDGDLSLSLGYFEGNLRSTFNFQITPRLSGSFRYSVIDRFVNEDEPRYDRSFDIRYLVSEEGNTTPAVTIGLRDFGGTGVYSGEYLAFGKTFDKLRATGGIGWGRLASHGGFTNPLAIFGSGMKRRSDQSGGRNRTGDLNSDNWFRGNAALFGGVEYQVNDKLILKAEYSSDGYTREVDAAGVDQKIPFNFGAAYMVNKNFSVTGALMYGTKAAILLNYTFSGKYQPYPGGVEAGGPPIMPRDQARALGWSDLQKYPGWQNAVRDRVAAGLRGQGLKLDGIEMTSASSIRVYIDNTHYNAVPEAIGRTARVLTNTLPPEIVTFDIIPVSNGITLSSITLNRADLEDLEFDFDGSWRMYSRTMIKDAADVPLTEKNVMPGAFPKTEYGIKSYLSPAYFDPDNPVRLDFGIQAGASYAPVPHLILSGSVRYPLVGNIKDTTRSSDSKLPHVRSDAALYSKESTLQINHLTAEYFYRPGRDLYGHLSTGLLEDMYAGISNEVLWRPVTGPLALGLEVSYVKQRDYDMLFDMRSYSVATGHASAYYDFGNGYIGELDAGRYLAGDWGATVSLDREFANGLRIGAFFTKTNVSASEFGEGSFDKGIRFWIPTSRVSGEPSMAGFGQTIRPLTRDGGQMLNIRNRLYDLVRHSQNPSLQTDWGRFWR